jgi:hypothetical protein
MACVKELRRLRCSSGAPVQKPRRVTWTIDANRRLEIVSLPLVISLIAPHCPASIWVQAVLCCGRQPRFQPQALSAGTSLANSSREGRQGAGRGARSGFRQYCAGGSTRSATNRASRLPRGPRVEQLPKTAG